MHPPVNRLVDMRAAGDAPARRRHRPELPSGGAATACRCWSCCRSIRRCRCAIRWRSARNSRSSRRAPARCCSPPPSRPSATAIVDRDPGGRRSDGHARGDRGAARRVAVARLRDAPLAGRRRLHQHLAAGARPHRRGDRRAHRSLPAAEGRPLRPPDRVFERRRRAAERISRGARRWRAQYVRLDCDDPERRDEPSSN